MAATAAAAATVHQPNFFELSGGDIKMSYSSTSFGGKPMFHYEDGKVKKDLPAIKSAATLSTDGVTTVHKRAIPGPTIFGQTDTYTVCPLEGTGRFRID
jgi:hypothetical protein